MPALLAITVLSLIPVVGPVYPPRAIRPVMSWSESIKEAFLRCHSVQEWERISRKNHPQGESDGWHDGWHPVRLEVIASLPPENAPHRPGRSSQLDTVFLYGVEPLQEKK
jgi:hypothetical protein